MGTNRRDSSIDAFFTLVRAGLWEKAGANHNLNVDLNEKVDWKEVYELAKEQSVIGLVLAGFDWFKVHDSWFTIPQDVLLQWIGEVQMLEQKNKAMNYFIALLIEKLRKEDIYAILVKGQGIAQCYERPLWRVCGDVDLFLSDDDYKKAKKFLIHWAVEVEKEDAGFKHLGLIIDDWIVELHGSLRMGLPNCINRELDVIQADTFYGGNVRSWTNDCTQVYMLGKENDVVYVFVHFLNHFYKEGLGLRQICDWCRLLWTYRNSLNHGLLESRIQKMGLTSEWKAFAAFAVEYLGMPADAMPLYNDNDNQNHNLHRKAELIKDFIMEVGNMGHNRGSWLIEHDSWLSRQYVVRKAFSMGRRISDLIRHARIFPLDSLRFFPRIMFNGLRSAVRGE